MASAIDSRLTVAESLSITSRSQKVRSTLRLRITLLSATVMAVVLVLASIVLVSAQHALLERSLDEAITERLDELTASIVAVPDWRVQLPDNPDADLEWQVTDLDGMVLVQSAGLQGSTPLAAAATEPLPVPIRTATEPALDEDAMPYRIASRRIESGTEALVLSVAADLEDVIASTNTLTFLLAMGIPAGVLAIAVLTWWVVGRALRPVELMRAEVARIGAANLERRVPMPAGDDEIARLALTMNQMLDRIEAASRRQQRFVADAAHELRTPLTRLRTRLEVDLAHPAESDPRATIDAALEETLGLGLIVSDLLELARLDADDARVRFVVVDLADIVLAEAARLRARGHVQVDATGVSGADVMGDPRSLDRAVRNLTDNAERHAALVVSLWLREQNGQAVLQVTDDGPGIPATEQERIFERFARLDLARSSDDGGVGLGLAICREIAAAHGGTVRVDNAGEPGARFVLTLPLASP